jgi:hypothetical protein
MRRFLLALVILAAAALTGWASAHADEGEAKSWSSRLWPWSSAKKDVPEAKKDAKSEPATNAATQAAAARRLRAELDWKRRAEVCQKLRQIAYETGDDELDRFAERLDQRVWDEYVKRLEGAPPTDGEFERVGIDFNKAPSAKATPAAKGKTREERP